MGSIFGERTKRKNAFDVDDNYLDQRRYIAESMAAEIEILSIKKESTKSR
jgi:hypothetical protein